MSFEFDIASKGGGRTAIRLSVPVRDLSPLLDAIARNMPASSELLLSALRVSVEQQLAQVEAASERLQGAAEAATELMATADSLWEWTSGLPDTEIEGAVEIGSGDDANDVAYSLASGLADLRGDLERMTTTLT